MIHSENIYIRPLLADDASALLELQNKNRSFFEKFSMVRQKDFYTKESQLKKI